MRWPVFGDLHVYIWGKLYYRGKPVTGVARPAVGAVCLAIYSATGSKRSNSVRELEGWLLAPKTGAAISITIATLIDVLVSTTHVIAGSIAGAGSVQRLKAVRWGLATKIGCSG